MKPTIFRAFGAVAAAIVFAASPAVEGQNVLPQPEQPFAGKIGRTTADSTPDFPKQIQAPKGAPNILIIPDR